MTDKQKRTVLYVIGRLHRDVRYVALGDVVRDTEPNSTVPFVLRLSDNKRICLHRHMLDLKPNQTYIDQTTGERSVLT